MSEEKINVTSKNEKVKESPTRIVDPFVSFVNSCFNDFDAADYMKTDIYDEGDNYDFEIELPGVDKKDVKLALERGYLTVSGKSQARKSNGRLVRQERYVGTFRRSFYLGDNVLKEDISAAMENGVLTIKIQKAQERKAKETYIDIA